MLRARVSRSLTPRPTGLRASLLARWISLPVVLLSGLTPACSRSSDAPSNCVFVSIDTLRADHVGCYGHPRASTPCIDRLAEQGTRFAVCTSSCPLTLPSHATMMTGTYPFVHGARDNGTFVLAEENVTLAEILRDAGYATHAQVGAAVLEPEFGLAQGFEVYGATFEGEAPAPQLGEGAFGLRDLQRSAQAVTDRAIAFLASRHGDPQPFFLFVHYYDPHQPYSAPEPYASRSDSGYLAEIAYTDAQVGRLLEALENAGHRDRTLVVLTSDHGDGLEEHGEASHGAFLYDSTLRVPLVLAAPGRIGAGQVVDTPVGLVDLLPTILELLGIDSPPGLQGTSLVPVLADPGLELSLATYAETLEPRVTFGYSELRALRQEGWKYVHGPRPELYWLPDDPGETQDRADLDGERLASMRAALRALIASAPALLGRGEAHVLDPEDVRRLAALGYASAEGPADDDDPHAWDDELSHFEPSGANPADKTREIGFFYAGLGAMRDGNFEIAISSWSSYLESHPDYAPGHSSLGQSYASLGRAAEAILSLQRALELDPERCGDRNTLGSMLAESGDRPAAREQFALALACDPTSSLALYNLGKVALLLGDPTSALRALDQLLASHPRYIGVHALRARALDALGRHDEAVDGMRAAQELEPRSPALRSDLAEFLGALGRHDEAARVYEDSLPLFPRNPALRAAAARFYMERGNGARALEILDASDERAQADLALATLRVRILSSDPDPTLRDGRRAMGIAEGLLRRSGDDPRVLAAAAAAAAENGHFERALELAQRALDDARERGHDALAARLAWERDEYSAGRPARYAPTAR